MTLTALQKTSSLFFDINFKLSVEICVDIIVYASIIQDENYII